MTRAEEYLKKAEEKNTKGKEHMKCANKCFDDEKMYLNAYRIESVNRVLDFVRSEYRAGRICNLETLLCHCQNKLNGNIDGTELDLEKGIPFRTEREED